MDSNKVHSIISKYLPVEWAKASPSDITAESQSGSGVVNTHYIVSCKSAGKVEPSVVHITILGGNIIKRDAIESILDEASLNVVYYGQSLPRLGHVPELFGLFPGGRIEEYIHPAHPMTPQETTDPAILSDVAKSFARYHSIPLPLDKDHLRKVFKQADFSAPIWKDFPQLLESLKPFDFKKEIDWVYSVFQQIDSKWTTIMCEVNLGNILVREGPIKAGQHRIVLIDLELTGYGPRGFDLGGFLTTRMMMLSADKSNNKLNKDFAYPDISMRKNFASDYLKEWYKLHSVSGGPSDREIGQLVKEMDVGSVAYSLAMALMIMCAFDQVKQAGFGDFILAFLAFHQQQKAFVIKEYAIQEN